MMVGHAVSASKRTARQSAAARTLLRATIAVAVWLVRAGSAQAQVTTTVEGELVLALPAALPTGLSTGAGLGVMHGDAFEWGARASWSTATESTLVWVVRHDDVRLRLLGGLQQRAGRGTFGLRLALGGTLVHETRTRAQGARAGLTGSDLQTTAWRMLPAADLEVVVRLQLVDDWSLSIGGGPSLHVLSGDPQLGWTSSLGIGWNL